MKTLESKIRSMNREILQIKTSHMVASSLKTFYGVYYYDADFDNLTHIYEISYAPGTNTIMTWLGWSWGTSSTVLGEIINNKQYLYDIHPLHTSNTDTFALFSTRQIVGVRKIQ